METEKEKEDKKKQSLFNKEEKKALVIGTFYVLLASISRIDLVGTAIVIFSALAGWGILMHGLKLVEINITNYGKEE